MHAAAASAPRPYASGGVLAPTTRRSGRRCPRALEPRDFELRSELPARRTCSAGERVLDLGCGEGASPPSSPAPAPRWWPSTSPRSRCAARARAIPSSSSRLIAVRRRSGRCPDASFDVVWAGEVIEHVADTAGWLSEVRRVLRPGGHAAAEHARARALRAAARSRSAGARSRAHFDPRGDHLRFYTRRSLERAARATSASSRSRCARLGGAAGARRAAARRARCASRF